MREETKDSGIKMEERKKTFSRSFYIPGAPGPKPHADSHRFVRAEEDDLGVSFNDQSQAPDIRGISWCVVFS